MPGPAPRGLPPGAGGRNSDGGFRTGPHQLAPQWPHESQRTGTRYSTQPTTRELQPTLRRATAMLAAGPRCTASLVGPAAWNNQRPTPRCRCCKAAAGGSRNAAVRSTTPLGLRRTNQRGWGLGYANLTGLLECTGRATQARASRETDPRSNTLVLLPRIKPGNTGCTITETQSPAGPRPNDSERPCNKLRHIRFLECSRMPRNAHRNVYGPSSTRKS